jgi:hypothetical protein
MLVRLLAKHGVAIYPSRDSAALFVISDTTNTSPATVSAVASAGCEEDCATATAGAVCYATPQTSATKTCPDGCQDKIDTMYSDCGGCQNFDDGNEAMATSIKTVSGCAGAAQAVPAMFVAVAAVVGHFLN